MPLYVCVFHIALYKANVNKPHTCFFLIITMLYNARKGGGKARFLIFTIKRYRSCANIDASGLTLKYWHISMDRRILITKYVAFVNNAVAN